MTAVITTAVHLVPAVTVININKPIVIIWYNGTEGNEMRTIAAFFLIALMLSYSGQYCFAQEEIVTADQLTQDDVEFALLSGAITSNCGMHGFPEHGATSLNPDTLIIKGIFQNDGTAKIHFMGRFLKSIRADEMPVVCEADLIRLKTGEWVDPNNGSILKK